MFVIVHKIMTAFLSGSLISILGIIILISSYSFVSYGQISVDLYAEFKPHENLLLAENDVYQMTQLSFNTTDKSICPDSSCEYTFENGELRYNAFVDEYAVEGLLRIHFIADENPKLYDIRIDLMVNSTSVDNNKTINLLSGNVSIGGNAVFNPYYEYEVKNGTLALYNNTPILNLQANKLNNLDLY